MRADLRKTKNMFGECWAVTVNGSTEYFHDFNTAVGRMSKKLKRIYKESCAYSMARALSANTLSIDEQDFVRKMCKCKCAGISMKQYGYLKGIHERQEREW